MNIKNLLMPNQAQDYLQSCLSNYCVQKTPVIIVMFDKPNQPCGLLYKMLKQNNLINCLVVPCKSKYSELKRFDKVIRRNFNDAFIIIVRSCDCSAESFGNICLNVSPLYFVTENSGFEGVGDACLTVCDNLVLKTPFKVSNIQKIQALSIISGVYNIICRAFNGN